MRSFLSQRPYLQMAVDALHPSILCLQETNLSPLSRCSISGYQPPLRYDRPVRRGGGVAMFLHTSLPFSPVPLPVPLEAVAARVMISCHMVTVCTLYLPPSLPLAEVTDNFPLLLAALPPPFLVLMDANAHHPQWGSAEPDARGLALADFFATRELVLLNNGEPTFLSPSGVLSHIDLSICSPALAPLLMWTTHHDPCNSDHFPVLLSSDTASLPDIVMPKWNLKGANWDLFRATLSLPQVQGTPEDACARVTQAILHAAQVAIPLQTRPPRANAAHWWTTACTVSRRAKNRALTRYRHHLGSLELWICYKKARALFRATVRQARKDSWETFLKAFNTSSTSAQVWRHVRLLRGTARSRAIVLHENGAYISSPLDVATTLAGYFSSKSDGSTNDPLFNVHRAHLESSPVVFPSDNSAFYNKPFSISELLLAVGSSTSRSPGSDRIPYAFLHHMGPGHSLALLSFFNYLYTSGYPAQWHTGIVMPIPKPQQRQTAKSSFRPITLTECLSKVLGKMVNRRLQSFLESISFFSPHQSGFRAGHCTLDGLSRLEFDARQAILMGHYCVAVFLDVARAFDTVWHHGLLLKLQSLGLSGNLARFLVGFLSDRNICVRVSGTTSASFPLRCGVPQGSVLSPTLFTVFINDIFADVPSSVRTSLYADDGALWVSAPKLLDAVDLMQQALTTLETWSHKWGLFLSSQKTTALVFTSRRPTFLPPLSLNGAPLSYVSSVRFLGLTFDKNLTWRPHITQLRDRCQSDLQLLRVVASQRWGADFGMLRRLYLALIVPKLDYGSILFATAAPSLLLQLDRVQYQAIRTILGALRCTPVAMLEAEADLLPLSYRRRQLLAQYGCRTLSIPSHPVTSIVQNYFPLQNYISTPCLLPALGRLHDELAFLGVEASNIPCLPMTLRYMTHSLPIFSSLDAHNKSSLSHDQWSLLFLDLVASKYSDCQSVYTDGSKTGTACGSAVWSPHFSLMSRLPSVTSVFTAELYALYSAVSFVSSRPGRFVIFTDSLSSVRALQSLCLTPHYLVYRISSVLLSLPPGKVVVEWVPGHVNIPGNTRADSLATVALSLPRINNISPSAAELRQLIRAAYYSAWCSWWCSLPLSFRSFKHSLGPTAFAEVDRPLQVSLTRLRLGVTPLTHRHLYSTAPQVVCRLCLCPVSLEHLFIQCPSHRLPRDHLAVECQALRLPLTVPSLLSPPFPVAVLLQFLQATGCLQLL